MDRSIRFRFGSVLPLEERVVGTWWPGLAMYLVVHRRCLRRLHLLGFRLDSVAHIQLPERILRLGWILLLEWTRLLEAQLPELAPSPASILLPEWIRQLELLRQQFVMFLRCSLPVEEW